MKSFALSVIILLALAFGTGGGQNNLSPVTTYEHSVPVFSELAVKQRFEHHESLYMQKKREVTVASILKEPALRETPAPVVAKTQPTKRDTVSEDDLYWLSRIVSAEAKGEPVKGQVAVANVVLNRVASDEFPDTIKDVIFQKGQFSPVRNGAINDKPTEEAIESAKKALEGEKVVNSRVFYFYNAETSTSSWVYERKTAKTIGNHTFAY